LAPYYERMKRLALLATAVLAAVGLGFAYAAGAVGGDSHPRVVGVAPPPPDAVELASIRQLVLEAATAMGEAAPTGGVVVPTTRRRAELVDVDTNEADIPVYFVLVRGRFTDYAARIPKGAEPPTGTILTLTIDAATNKSLGIGLVRKMPDVNAIGTPEPLQLADRPPTLRTELRLTKHVPCLQGDEPRVGPDALHGFEAVTAVSCIYPIHTYPGQGQWEVRVRRVAVGSVAGLQRYFEQPDSDLPKNAVCSAVLVGTLVPILVDARSEQLVPRTPVDACNFPLDGGPPNVPWHVVSVHKIKQIVSQPALAAKCPMEWGNLVAVGAGPVTRGGPVSAAVPRIVHVCVYRSPPNHFATGHFVRGFTLGTAKAHRLLRAMTRPAPPAGTCPKLRTFAVLGGPHRLGASIELGGCWRVARWYPQRGVGAANPAVAEAILGSR
jgi:hypothetical protein